MGSWRLSFIQDSPQPLSDDARSLWSLTSSLINRFDDSRLENLSWRLWTIQRKQELKQGVKQGVQAVESVDIKIGHSSCSMQNGVDGLSVNGHSWQAQSPLDTATWTGYPHQTAFAGPTPTTFHAPQPIRPPFAPQPQTLAWNESSAGWSSLYSQMPQTAQSHQEALVVEQQRNLLDSQQAPPNYFNPTSNLPSAFHSSYGAYEFVRGPYSHFLTPSPSPEPELSLIGALEDLEKGLADFGNGVLSAGEVPRDDIWSHDGVDPFEPRQEPTVMERAPVPIEQGGRPKFEMDLSQMYERETSIQREEVIAGLRRDEEMRRQQQNFGATPHPLAGIRPIQQPPFYPTYDAGRNNATASTSSAPYIGLPRPRSPPINPELIIHQQRLLHHQQLLIQEAQGRQQQQQQQQQQHQQQQQLQRFQLQQMHQQNASQDHLLVGMVDLRYAQPVVPSQPLNRKESGESNSSNGSNGGEQRYGQQSRHNTNTNTPATSSYDSAPNSRRGNGSGNASTVASTSTTPAPPSIPAPLTAAPLDPPLAPATGRTKKTGKYRNPPSTQAPGGGRRIVPKLEIEEGHVGPKCSHCSCITTPLWRRGPEDQLLCNACGLYLKLHSKPRPLKFGTQAIGQRGRTTTGAAALALASLVPPSCFVCSATSTPMWRKDANKNLCCNACSLYFKLHGTTRPLSLSQKVKPEAVAAAAKATAEARRASASTIPHHPLASSSTLADPRVIESAPQTRRSSQEDVTFAPTMFPGQQNYQPTLVLDTRLPSSSSAYLVDSPAVGISPVLVGVASSLNWRTASLATTTEIRRPISPLYQIGSSSSRPTAMRERSLSNVGMGGGAVGGEEGGGRKRMRIDESFERGSPSAGALEEMV